MYSQMTSINLIAISIKSPSHWYIAQSFTLSDSAFLSHSLLFFFSFTPNKFYFFLPFLSLFYHTFTNKQANTLTHLHTNTTSNTHFQRSRKQTKIIELNKSCHPWHNSDSDSIRRAKKYARF